MALPGISWLLLSLLVIAMATPVAGSSEKIARTGLIKCYDAAPTLTNGTVFRASLLLLLASLPSAAAPTGFASLNATGHDSVFVRGLCFGGAPAPSECHGCLSAAAKNLTSGCRATTRRAGVWTNGCFVAYADTDASSPSEDAFRSRVLLRDHVAVPVPGSDGTNQSGHQHHMLVLQAWLVALDAAANISGTRMLGTADDTSDDGWPVTVRSTVHVLAQCGRDRTKDECISCLLDSVQAVGWDLGADRGDGGVAAAVVGFNCYLRFQVSSSEVHQEISRSCGKQAHTGVCAHTGSFLVQCYDAEPALTNATNGTEFLATLRRLLLALPFAAAPTGFASLNATGRDSLFVRGLCFGDAPAPSECHGCLSVAAKNLTSGCRATTRRAGLWSDGCFLAYADTDYSTPSEVDFRARFLLGGHVAVPVTDADAAKNSAFRHTEVVAMAQFAAAAAVFNVSGSRMLSTAKESSRVYAGWSVTMRSTVRVLAQCPRDRTEHDCTMCLLGSARAVDWDLDAARGDGGVAAAVVGFNCYLRFEVNSSLVSHETDISGMIVVGGPVTALTLLAPMVYPAILRNWQ